jgi:hypothetical protein
MNTELFYFDELADPRYDAEPTGPATKTNAEICWQPHEIARLRSPMADNSEGKMPHEKIKS